jgi:hypothetical protein
VCEAELGGPFDQDGDVIPDGAVIKQLMLFGNDLLNGRAVLIREAFDQAVHDRHERPGFGFFGHSQSFNPGTRNRQQADAVPVRTAPEAARLAL